MLRLRNSTRQPTIDNGATTQIAGVRNGRTRVLSETRRSMTPSDTAAAREYFLARHHQPYIAAVAELGKLRVAENALIADVPEIMVMDELPTPRETHLLKRGAYETTRLSLPSGSSL